MNLRRIAALLLALVMLLGLTACAADTEDVLSAADEVIAVLDDLAAGEEAEPEAAEPETVIPCSCLSMSINSLMDWLYRPLRFLSASTKR